MQPRGIRNKNPGNIRKSFDKWQGLSSKQLDCDFFQFNAPEWGIRALARILVTYQAKHKLKSVQAIIGRWAPPNENNTPAYVASVAKKLGVAPTADIDVTNPAVMRPLVEAIIFHENGQQPYPAGLLDKAMELAGLKPKEGTQHA